MRYFGVRGNRLSRGEKVEAWRVMGGCRGRRSSRVEVQVMEIEEY